MNLNLFSTIQCIPSGGAVIFNRLTPLANTEISRSSHTLSRLKARLKAGAPIERGIAGRLQRPLE